MKSLKQLVEESLKQKKSPEISAKRCGISVEKWLEIRKELRDEAGRKREIQKLEEDGDYTQAVNIEAGEARFQAKTDKEPKSADEIIKLLKIDTNIWKLSSYWNKQMGDHWRVSALVTRKRFDNETLIQELIDKWKPKSYKLPKVKLHSNDKIKVCGVLSLQDIHFGKEGNYTIDKDFEDTIISLITRASASHYIENLFYVVGGDLINMDTFNGTTTSGTFVDNSSTAPEAYIQAFDAIHWSINYLNEYCEKLTVVYIPGNHDRLSSFHLAHALSKTIKSDKIEWDVEYGERKVHTYGENFNAFEHGDVNKKNTPLVYATEFPMKWGKSKNRTLFTGHFHSNKRVEYITANENTGFIHKTLPSLSRSDYWHTHNKFVGNRRSGKLELQDPIKGNICELTFSP
jgi:hypothetical protein